MFLPRALSSVADAQNALERIRSVFEAETSPTGIDIEADMINALTVKGTFAWDEHPDLQVHLTVDRGQLVAVAGPIGCGKSSLLQAIIGEMPCKEGSVHLGASVAYVQQNGTFMCCGQSISHLGHD